MLTVLMATHNGAGTLPDVLETHCQLQPPPGGWKLIIVDNASTDRTKEIVVGFQDRLPLTYLFEPILGKNWAVNAGLAYISGDLVVFTDDNAFPKPDWLVEMRTVADTHPSFSIFGAVVRPRWENSPPEWILRRVPLGPAYALSSPTEPEGPSAPHHVFGPNMAVRANAFGAGHRFEASVGPCGKNYAMGSESEFARRLHRLGFSVWFSERPIVEHYIRAYQLTRSWIFGRARRFGRGQYLRKATEQPLDCVLWFGVPRYVLGDLLRQVFRMARGILRLDGDEVFRALCQTRC